jgi:hypothetical protein
MADDGANHRSRRAARRRRPDLKTAQETGGQLPACHPSAARAAGPRPPPGDGAGSSRAHLAVESRGEAVESGEIWGRRRRRLEGELLAVLLVRDLRFREERERKKNEGFRRVNCVLELDFISAGKERPSGRNLQRAG